MRITREQMFMDIAEIVAKRSTCLRNNVGAIIVDDNTNNIVSIGYNGVPAGCEHCTTKTCIGKGCDKAIHAERNAISRGQLSVDHTYSIYTTVSPCPGCSKLIANMPEIKKIYYRYEYRDKSGIMFLNMMGREVYRILPSGEVIKEGTEWNGK